jgi:lipopolysaccharide export system permease protein
MRTVEMVRLVDTMKASINETRSALLKAAPGRSDYPRLTDSGGFIPARAVPADDTTRVALAGLGVEAARDVYLDASAVARLLRGEIDTAHRTIERQQAAINRYEVEIHKKYSIAVACLVFLLVGAPLGLSIRRSSLAMTGAIATGIFVFYWVTLVFGEKLADRGFIAPGVGMWIANVVTLIAAVYLIAYVSLDVQATAPVWRRVLDRIRGQ